MGEKLEWRNVPSVGLHVEPPGLEGGVNKQVNGLGDILSLLLNLIVKELLHDNRELAHGRSSRVPFRRKFE